MPPRLSIKKRNRQNRGRGKRFEYLVEKRLRGKKYPAERIFYSGAGAKKPYDVEVTFSQHDILEFEAKRTWKESLSFQSKWMALVGERHTIAFAMGTMANKIFALSAWPKTFVVPTVISQRVKVGKKFKDMLVGSFSIGSSIVNAPVITMTGKYLCVHLKDIDIQMYTIFVYQGNYYLIQSLEAYMDREWIHKLAEG